jgi:hypothetical protein
MMPDPLERAKIMRKVKEMRAPSIDFRQRAPSREDRDARC